MTVNAQTAIFSPFSLRFNSKACIHIWHETDELGSNNIHKCDV